MDLQQLPEIFKLLNDRFGTNFEPADEGCLESLEQWLDEVCCLSDSLAVNNHENARFTSDHIVRDHVQDIMETNFKFYKQINDRPNFADYPNNLLFDRQSERKILRSD